VSVLFYPNTLSAFNLLNKSLISLKTESNTDIENVIKIIRMAKAVN